MAPPGGSSTPTPRPRKPDFFVVGAPKCGTTSLADWLARHPQVCMSQPKEPHYFHPDFVTPVRTLDDYEACFAHADPEHEVLGEASTHLVFSDAAIDAVLAYRPAAKLIVCLRNPIAVALSIHNAMVYRGTQPIRDFLEAWESDAPLALPTRRTRFTSRDYYRFHCALGTRTQSLLERGLGDRLLTLLLDDVAADSAAERTRITAFLGVRPHPEDYPKSNPARRARSVTLARAVKRLTVLKHRLGIRTSFGVARRVLRANTATGPGETALTPEILGVLAAHFEPEIALLERLLDRDLSHWRRGARGGL